MVGSEKVHPNNSKSTIVNKFTRLGFKKCRCNIIIPQEKEPTYCECGKAIAEHSNVNQDDTDKTIPEKWTRDKCAVEDGPTDAYGYISFLGASEIISPYMRLSYETKKNKVIELLFDKKYWNIPKPSLLISVTGGAQVDLNPRLKDIFFKGLVKVVTTTNPLIVTGGTSTGCMKLVGEAFKNNVASMDLVNKMILLGIANWGSVTNREKLVHTENSLMDSGYNVEYELVKPIDNRKNKHQLLDPNHTHFIMVDDSTCKFGGEVGYRSELESEIAKRFSIPVVLLVIAGGPNTIKSVYESALNGSPCVLLEGSGQSADILIYALKEAQNKNKREKELKEDKSEDNSFSIDDDIREKIRAKFKNQYPNKQAADHEKMLEYTELCLEHEHLINVCNINTEIDVAILHALLRSEKVTSETESQSQLKLALSWNRVDIARKFIFTEDRKDNMGSLDNLMYLAILQNRIEFVELFLENGFSMKNFVTYRLMFKLYNDIPESSLLFRLLNRMKQQKMGKRYSRNLKHIYRFKNIGQVIAKLTNHLYSHIFQKQPKFSYLNYDQSKNILEDTDEYGKKIPGTVGIYNGFGDKDTEINVDDKFTSPYHELLIFNILLGRVEMSKLFITYSDDSISSALIAKTVFDSYASLYGEEAESYHEQAKDFEMFGHNLLEAFYDKDGDRARISLIRSSKIYNNNTCMQIAVASKSVNVIAHPCFQNLLVKIWYDRILHDVSNTSLAVSFILPFLAPVLVSFQKRKSERPKIKYDEEATGDIIDKIDDIDIDNDISIGIEESTENEGPSYFEEHNYIQKLFFFLSTPYVKFVYHQAFFLLFLILFSYVLLCDFYPIGAAGNPATRFNLAISVPEVVLIIWVFTLFFEMIREFMLSDRKVLKKEIQESGNIFNGLAVLGFVIGMILRFIPNDSCYLAARIIMCLDIILWFLKSLYTYKFLRSVGPKLYMIKKMLFQLLYFLLIVVLFMFAFGISTHSMMFHNQALDAKLLKNIFFPAYFIIGGEYYTMDLIMEPQDTDCQRSTSISTTDVYPENECPEEIGATFSLVLYVIYLIFLNILLVNLLIAIFNNTYQLIESEANKIWKFDRYYLVFNFYSKPRLPPPFTILSYFVILIRTLIHQCLKLSDSFNDDEYENDSRLVRLVKKIVNPNKNNHRFVHKFEDSNNEAKIIKWESYNMDEYVFKEEKELKETIDFKLEENGHKLEELSMKFDEIIENQANFDLNKSIDEINKNIHELIKALK